MENVKVCKSNEGGGEVYATPYLGCLLGSAFQRLIIRLDAALKREELPITSAEYMILRALYSRDGLQQCEIVDMVGKDKASICRSVSVLAKKGFVKTEAVSYKCIRVWLTEMGREIEPAVMRIADERHKALLKLASPAELETFEKVLRSIIKHV